LCYKGSQCSVYDCIQPIAPQNTEDTSPTLIDNPNDAYFPDVVGPVQQFILIIVAANTSKMNSDVPMPTFYY
jgi:hypothetical protein